LARIFISYSYKDEDWFARLYNYLLPFSINENIEIWSDKAIPLGENWHNAVDKAIKSSKAAVLLVSADYLASKFIGNFELPLLIKRTENHELILVPVLVRPFRLGEDHPLLNYQFVNSLNKPLASANAKEQEQTLLVAAKKIVEIAGEGKPAVPKESDDLFEKAMARALAKVVPGSRVGTLESALGTANIFAIAERKMSAREEENDRRD